MKNSYRIFLGLMIAQNLSFADADIKHLPEQVILTGHVSRLFVMLKQVESGTPYQGHLIGCFAPPSVGENSKATFYFNRIVSNGQVQTDNLPFEMAEIDSLPQHLIKRREDHKIVMECPAFDRRSFNNSQKWKKAVPIEDPAQAVPQNEHSVPAASTPR